MQVESPTMLTTWEWAPSLLLGWGGLVLPAWEWVPWWHTGRVTNCHRSWGWLPSEPWGGVTSRQPWCQTPLTEQRRSHQLCCLSGNECLHSCWVEGSTACLGMSTCTACTSSWLGRLTLPAWEGVSQWHAGGITNYADCHRSWGQLPLEPWGWVTRVETVKNQFFQVYHTLPK